MKWIMGKVTFFYWFPINWCSIFHMFHFSTVFPFFWWCIAERHTETQTDASMCVIFIAIMRDKIILVISNTYNYRLLVTLIKLKLKWHPTSNYRTHPRTFFLELNAKREKINTLTPTYTTAYSVHKFNDKMNLIFSFTTTQAKP